MKPLRILITSAGRRVGLAEAFRTAAACLGAPIEVHACDMAPDYSAGCALADVRFAVPACTAPGYVEALLEHCGTHGIDLLVPTIDTELPVFARAADAFSALGCRVLVAAPELIDIVRDKGQTCTALAAAGVPVPQSHAPEDLYRNADTVTWPVFAKPAGGSASRGLEVLRGPEDVAVRYEEPMVFQDLLSGPEYTINVFVDRAGRFRTAIPHLRLSVRAGEVEKGRTVRDPRFTRIAREVVAALPGMRGVLCFQLIDDLERGPCVFEINARFGGGYPLADRAGATFARWLLEEVLDGDSGAHDDWRDGIEMIRYDAAVYRDAAGVVI